MWHGTPSAEQPILTWDTWTVTTKILHAADASGATIIIFWRHPEQCKDTTFSIAPRRKSTTVQLGPIYEALGSQKAAALPSLHTMSGSDNTGSFAGKGKHAFWKAFQDSSEGFTALINLGATNELQDDTVASMIKSYAHSTTNPDCHDEAAMVAIR